MFVNTTWSIFEFCMLLKYFLTKHPPPQWNFQGPPITGPPNGKLPILLPYHFHIFKDSYWGSRCWGSLETSLTSRKKSCTQRILDLLGSFFPKDTSLGFISGAHLLLFSELKITTGMSSNLQTSSFGFPPFSFNLVARCLSQNQGREY